MSEIASVWVSVVPSFKGGQKAIAEEFGAAGDPAGKKAGKGFMGGLGSTLGGAGKLAAGTVAVVGTALAGIAVKGGISRALNIEDARAQLTGLGHDTKSIDGLMANALTSVKGTSFGLSDAAGAAATFAAAGVTAGADMERALTLTGDAATIAGTGFGDMSQIFGKVAAKGKLDGDVMSQLLERQIGILPGLAAMYGVSTEEAQNMVSSGKVSFQDFATVMETTLGGAAQASGDTFRGALANTGSAMSRIGETFITPFLGSLQGGLTGAIPMLDSLNDSLKPVMESFGEWLSTNLPIFIDKISTAVSSLAGWVTGTAIPALQSFGSWFSANQGAIQTVAIIIGATLVPVLIRLGVQATIAAAKNVAAWVMMVAGAVGGAVAYVVQSAIIVASWVLMGAQALLAGARMAAAWLLAMGPIGIVIALVVGLVALIIANWDSIKAATIAVFNAVVSFITSIPGRIMAGLAALGQLAGKMAEWVGGMYNSAVTKFGEIVSYVGGVPGKILSALGNMGTLLLDAGGQILSGFLDGLTAGFEKVKDFVGGIGSWIADNKGPKAYDLALLVPAGGWIMSGLEKGIEQSMPSLGSTLGDVSWMIANGIDPGVTAGVKANVSASAPVGALASSPTAGVGAAGSGATINQYIEANDTEGVVQEVMGRLRFEFAKQGVRLGG